MAREPCFIKGCPGTIDVTGSGEYKGTISEGGACSSCDAEYRRVESGQWRLSSTSHEALYAARCSACGGDFEAVVAREVVDQADDQWSINLRCTKAGCREEDRYFRQDLWLVPVHRS